MLTLPSVTEAYSLRLDVQWKLRQNNDEPMVPAVWPTMQLTCRPRRVKGEDI